MSRSWIGQQSIHVLSQRMPGLILVIRSASYAVAIEDLLLVADCLAPEEMEGQIYYVPLR